MKQTIKISYAILILIFTIGCGPNIVSEDVGILSLIFNSQIGDYEHFGSPPPPPPPPLLPPSFDDLDKYSNIDTAKIYLTSIEWQQYFKQEEKYEEIVESWKKRM